MGSVIAICVNFRTGMKTGVIQQGLVCSKVC